MRLKDKVAIITGGSRGIGFATADKFLKEGASVVLAASSQESADVAVDKLKEKYPNAIVAGISPNLASMESVRKAFKEATEKYGCVDILVNNAGISENTSFMDYTEETFDKVMNLNVKGVFNTTRVAAECMVARGKGVILSTSSMVSISGQPSGFAYPASKFAVNGLTVSLARELGPKELKNMTSININKEKFGQLIHKEKPVLVDFWAPWCGYCRRIGAAYEKISEEYSDILIAGKVNIDEEPQIAEAEKIEVIPTLVLYRNGKAIDSIVAPESKIMIENFINEALEK